MSKLKLLHIIPSYYPALKYGGPLESVRALNIALAGKGVHIDVITTSVGINIDLKLEIGSWKDDSGVRVKYFPSYFYEHFTFSPGLFFSVLNEVKKYDLVHITAFWNFPVFAGSFACLLKKKPYIISPRGVLYEDAINIKSKYIKKTYYELIAKHYLNSASAVHFTTEHEREGLAKFIKLMNDSFVVPNGIDLAKYKNLPNKGSFRKKFSISNDKKIILFLGRIHKQKGIDLLINSFEECVKNCSDLLLVVVGSGDENYVNSIKRTLNEKGIIQNTLFTGFLKSNEKLAAYIDSDIFILPSYFENFGMSVIEAMACGVPVVVSNQVGISKDIEIYNAGTVVGTNVQSICKGVKQILENPSLSKELTNNAKELLLRNYEISNVADKMISAYEKYRGTV